LEFENFKFDFRVDGFHEIKKYVHQTKENLILHPKMQVKLWITFWFLSIKSEIPLLFWKVRCLRNLTAKPIKIKWSLNLYARTKNLSTI